MPLVTVLMSVYNGARYLRDAIGSVRAQTFGDYEFVIVDDGSTDDTPQILSSYDDPRIKVIRNQPNIGLPRSLNKGLAIAQGKYVARLDADDFAAPDRLALQVAYMERNPETVLLGGACLWTSDQGSLAAFFDEYRGLHFETDPQHEEKWITIDRSAALVQVMLAAESDLMCKWQLLSRTVFSHSAVMFRRSVCESLGGYTEDPTFRVIEDRELWIRFARRGRIANLPNITTVCRRVEGSICSIHKDTQKRLEDVLEKQSICWLMNWPEVDIKLWAAWRKFWPTGGAQSSVGLLRDDFVRLRTFLPDFTSRFYAAYKIPELEARSHRAFWNWLYGKHALALAGRPRSGLAIAARIQAALLGLELLARIVVPAEPVPTAEHVSTNPC